MTAESVNPGLLGPEPARHGRVRAFLRLVMIEHSVFALPFAYIAALTAMRRASDSVHWWQLLLVTVAMVGLRTFAMAANRIIDREIDARNPRTAGRELVTGAVSVRSAWTGALVALVVFLGAAALLNPLCLALAPIAVVPMVVYPYGKRFTDFPHAHPRAGAGDGPDRRLARGDRQLVVGRGDPGPGRRGVDRRLRPDLRLPGRGRRPGARRALGAGPLRHRRRPVRRPRRAPGDHRTAGLVRAGHRRRGVVVDRHRLVAVAFLYEHSIVGPATCPGSTGRSSRSTASSASRCSPSRCSTWSRTACAPDAAA